MLCSGHWTDVQTLSGKTEIYSYITLCVGGVRGILVLRCKDIRCIVRLGLAALEGRVGVLEV